MELPEVGKNCIICNRNDYLPFKCAHCDKIVCIDHKTNHGSECPLLSNTFTHGPAITSESLKKACDFCHKITLKLELVECAHCQSFHCLYHRHQVQHQCKQLDEMSRQRADNDQARKRRQDEALERLRQISKPATGVPTPANPPNIQPLNPKKRELAKKIRIMKIKQSARGPPNVLPQDRLYFEVKFIHNPLAELSDPTKSNKTLNLFASRQLTLGRIVDWSAEELGLRNKNHRTGNAHQLVFVKPTDTETQISLNSQESFGYHLEAKVFEEGDQLILTYQDCSV